MSSPKFEDVGKIDRRHISTCIHCTASCNISKGLNLKAFSLAKFERGACWLSIGFLKDWT